MSLGFRLFGGLWFLGFRFWGLGLKDLGFRIWVSGLGFRFLVALGVKVLGLRI